MSTILHLLVWITGHNIDEQLNYDDPQLHYSRLLMSGEPISDAPPMNSDPPINSDAPIISDHLRQSPRRILNSESQWRVACDQARDLC
jgi:hypothetical protein